MHDLNWQTIKGLFADALDQPEATRLEFLRAKCNGNDQLYNEVASLLDTADEDLIESNAINLAAKITGETVDHTDRHFGNYRIIREIGTGGMGSVFLAERDDGEFNMQVALKIVRATVADRVTTERFRQERQILAKLHHPNIAVLHDGGVNEKGEPFLAMEFVDGESLIDYCRNHNLSMREKLTLFVKVCSAVSYAHRNLVVHRDIKPANILVTSSGEPKLLDFGLAKIFVDGGENTQTVLRAFTPAYASPEQIKGGTITTASDIYSLGVVLYELLTGVKPLNVDSGNYDEILRTITAVEPPNPSQAGDHELSALRGDLDNIALTALRKEPERRYVSAEAFSQDVEKYLNGFPISARPNTVAYRLEKLYQRNRLAFVVGVLLIASVLGGLGVSLWQARRAGIQRDLAQAEKEKAEKINRFLQQMLSFSNQSFTSISPIAQSKNVTVNEMLDQMTPLVEAELADQPEVLARILRTVGSSYASQGFYEKGERNLRASLDIQKQISAENTIDAADTMIELGVLNYRQSKFEDSRKLLETAVDFYRDYQKKAPANSPARLVQALDFLAVNRYYSGDAKAAVALFEEGIEIGRQANLQGKEREVIAGITVDYSLIVTRLGDGQRGETLVLEGLRLYNEISTEPRWEVGNAKVLLSANLAARNDLGSAEKAAAESEDILRKTLGDSNIYLASTFKGQANIYIKKGDFAAAEKAARSSLAIYADLFPADNAFSGGSLVSLGIILTKTNRAAEAEPFLRRALAIYESQPTKNYTLIMPAKTALAENLIAQNRPADAKSVITEAIAEARETFGPYNPLMREAQNLSDVVPK